MENNSSELLNGRYKPSGAQHSGGSGNILLCEDVNLQRPVAIKFLQPASARRRIFDEVAALQKIRSKNVVEILDIVLTGPDRRVGIVQEYIVGDDLLALTKTKLDVEYYLKILYQIASGITDIHSVDHIHRDIKPNNIRLDREGIIKIFDFDLAREEGAKSNTVGFRGTPGFAAPELYQFGRVDFTKKVDVYAFGATAVFLADGTLPDELASSPPNPASWIDRGGFAQLRISLPDELVPVLNLTLHSDSTQRPSMSSICEILGRHLTRNNHRALLTHSGKTYILSKNNRTVSLSKNGIGAVWISYTGLSFVVDKAEGDIWINNTSIRSGNELPGSCVISIGGPTVPYSSRVFVTVDVSHPEVVL